MCIETMDLSSEPIHTSCTRRNNKRVSKMRWKLSRVSAHKEEQALKLCRVNIVRTTVPKHLRREQKREALVRRTNVKGREDQKASVSKTNPPAAWLSSRPAGAMAPGNTTQYLMSKVYEDVTMKGIQSVQAKDVRSGNLYRDCLSPVLVYAELDSHYESSLDFQMQDFEEVFDQNW